MANTTIGLNPTKAELYTEEDTLVKQILVSGLTGTPKAPTAISATGTVVSGNYEEITADNAITRTLPSGSTGAVLFFLHKAGSGIVTITAASGDTVGSAPSITLTPGRLTQLSFAAGDWKVS